MTFSCLPLDSISSSDEHIHTQRQSADIALPCLLQPAACADSAGQQHKTAAAQCPPEVGSVVLTQSSRRARGDSPVPLGRKVSVSGSRRGSSVSGSATASCEDWISA